jgi:amino-acid N-acetyltransferase
MIRKADIQNVKSIHSLLDIYSKKGDLIARPLSELYDHIRDFFVFVNEEDNSIEGCCALQFCWEDLAEIRSLAVDESHQKKKIGSRLVEAAIDEAKQFKIKDVFTLTYRPDFFSKFGFKVIDRSELPLKIWADCILCVKFPDCDETAMMKRLRS